MKLLLIFCLSFIGSSSISASFAQQYVIRNIKSFGAKGDGKTNDHLAFQKAATYFNKRGGNGKLIISKGKYIVGRQTFTGGKPNKPAYDGEDVLHLIKLKNFAIAGTANSIIKYKDSLRFGSFSPVTGLPHHQGNNFRINSYAALIGKCIYFDSCSNVSVTNLTLDGNNKSVITGGIWGDVGRQLTHYGIFIVNSNNVIVDKLNVSHFALDGINVANKINLRKDSISILNSVFQYNSRQGMSWTGGNHLVVKNCEFNHTGKKAFSSPPTAGVDIEAEYAPIENGYFTNCKFINNTGVGLLASTGDIRDCTFTDCTFWGATNWSIWVTKPGFTFNGCNIYGSTVHGYSSPDENDATKFINCTFEDKLYKGKEPYGNFLIESNNAKRQSFINCKFIANRKKLCWILIDPKIKQEEKYKFINCSFELKNVSNSKEDLVGLIRGAVLKNSTFNFKNPIDKKKGAFSVNYNEGQNIDLGGNKIIYTEEK
jgi:hypothetical protein